MSDKANEQNEDDKTPDPYFNMKNAVEDVKKQFANGDGTDKAISSAKLVGKALFNAGLFTSKLGWEAIKATPQILEGHNNKIRELKEKYENMDDEQLFRIIHSTGVFGKAQEDRAVVFSILKKRGFSIEDINSKTR